MAKQEERQTLMPGRVLVDTRPSGRRRKPSRLRGFPAPGLGQLWPGARPGQPGPKFAQQRPNLAGSGLEFGRPSRDLGLPLNIREVAELIGCSPWTVRQTLIPRGLPYFRSGASGKLIFYTNQVVGWIEKQQGGITTK
jgi:hypothetical protein